MSSDVYASDPWFPSQKNAFTVFSVLTHKCNQKCLHCFATNCFPEKPLLDQEWLRLIDQLTYFEAPRLFFTGGEPLAHPSIYKLIAYASNKSIPTILGTNATLVNQSVSRKLVDSGLKEARVSLDGANKKSHDLLRGEGSYDKTVLGIQTLINAGITISIRTTINKLNFEEVFEIGKLISSMNIQNWEIKNIIPSGRALEHPELLTTKTERSIALESLIKIYSQKLFPDINIKLMEGTLNNSIDLPDGIKVACCPAGRSMVLVQPNGDIIPCGYLSSNVLGNIRRDYIMEVIKKHKEINNRIVPPKCQNCKHFYMCKGGCPAYSFCDN